MDNSQLAKGLYAIPLLNFGLNKASSAYSYVRGYNIVTYKTLEWAEATTGFVLHTVRQNRITQTGLSLVGNKLEALDNLAAQRLADLETKVPAINTQPEEVIPAVKEKVGAVRDKVWKSSEWILETKPAQLSFDVMDFFLSHAASTLDKVLPPKDGNKTGLPTRPGKGSERAVWVVSAACEIVKETKERVVEHMRGRLGSSGGNKSSSGGASGGGGLDAVAESSEDKENLGTD